MEKILNYLNSKDPDMIKLGAILALEQGPSWCLQNLPPFGYVDKNSKSNVIKSPNDLEYQCFVKDGIAIVFRAGYLQCRRIEHFKKSSRDRYKITEL